MWKSILGGDDEEERDECFFDDQTNTDDELCNLSYTQVISPLFLKLSPFMIFFPCIFFPLKFNQLHW